MTAPTKSPAANALLPCGTDSARRRHIIRTESCPTCAVEGSIPEAVWKARTS